MTARNLNRGDAVWVGRSAPNIVAGSTRSTHDAATLVRPYPGGQYDSGTLWVVELPNGAQTVADESMMTTQTPTVACSTCSYAYLVTEPGCRNPWCRDMHGADDEHRARIDAAVERAERERAEREERQRLYASSFTTR